MCGIVGFVGENAESILVSRLKQLEYRGYDSAGIATLGENGLKVFKSKGEIKNLEKIIVPQTNTFIGIGHTRWATHGKPDEQNAHPHISNDKRWIIVHNGIIENYLALKEQLKDLGFSFYSNTDTEIVANLLEYVSSKNTEKDVLSIIKETCTMLKGSFALGIINTEQNKLYFAKHKSPLFFAIKNNKSMIASDVICFKDFSENYYEINDNEFGYVDNEKFEVFNSLSKVEPVAKKCDFCFVDSKNEFQHFMIKEIYETKSVIQNILNFYNENDYASKLKKLDIKNINRIKLVGCGTAYHACLVGEKLLSSKLNIDCNSYVASEFRYCPPIIDENTLVVVVSQSGETADSLAGLELAKSKGAKTIGIINVEYSAMAKKTDLFLPLKAGIERAVASTKAYSAQLIVLYVLSVLLDNVLNDNEISFKEIENLYNAFDYGNENVYRLLADIFQYNDKLFMIGRGLDYCTALEASLKIKETSYITSSTYFAGELKHGFLALIDEKTYVIVFATDKEVLSKTLSNAEEASARGAKIILFTCLDLTPQEIEKFFYVIKVKNTNSLLQTVYNIVPWQIIAYYTSINKGINPDKPRNLAKSVTVE